MFLALNVPPAYSHCAALIVGVSRYSSTSNPAVAHLPDLPEVRASVRMLKKLWQSSNFETRVVCDGEKGDAVTCDTILLAASGLLQKSFDRDSLLIVHLIGHGADASSSGLILSDAHVGVRGTLTNFNQRHLRAILEDGIDWPGCNVLVICDFCNASEPMRLNDDDTFACPVSPVFGFGRQLIACASSVRSYRSGSGATMTFMTELLWRALGPSLAGFRHDESVITAAELRRRLQVIDRTRITQGLTIGRIWHDWRDTCNSGDIIFFRDPNTLHSSQT